jgi:hypothetical protein
VCEQGGAFRAKLAPLSTFHFRTLRTSFAQVVAQRLDIFQIGGLETLDELAVDLGGHLACLVAATLKFRTRLRISHLGRGRASPWNVLFDLARQLPAEGLVFGPDVEIGS